MAAAAALGADSAHEPTGGRPAHLHFFRRLHCQGEMRASVFFFESEKDVSIKVRKRGRSSRPNGARQRHGVPALAADCPWGLAAAPLPTGGARAGPFVALVWVLAHVEPRRAHGHAAAAALRKNDGVHGRQGHLSGRPATRGQQATPPPKKEPAAESANFPLRMPALVGGPGFCERPICVLGYRAAVAELVNCLRVAVSVRALRQIASFMALVTYGLNA